MQWLNISNYVFSKYYGHYLCQDVCCNFLCDRLFSSRYIWKFIFCKQAILVTWVMKIRNLALHRKSIIIIHQNYEIVIHCIFYNIITINYGALNSSELMQVRTWLTNQHWHNFVTRCIVQNMWCKLCTLYISIKYLRTIYSLSYTKKTYLT